MRIISALVALRIAIALVLPQAAMAYEATPANETKINLKIQNIGITDSEHTLKNIKLALLTYNPNDFKVSELIEVKKIDLDRQKVLARYEAKLKQANLPKGKFTINASAYTAAADECGKSDGITASGLMVKENETIACPPQFPFGTKLHIEGMGTYVCQDRGGAIKGNHIDIYMETKAQAFSFGRRNLLAQVVK